MKNNKLFKSTSFLMISALFVAMSCQDEDRFTNQDSQDVTEEALTEAYFQDLDDMSTVALESDNATDGGRVASGGREIVIQDERFNCDGVVVTIEAAEDSEPSHPRGTIIVDFGTSGCKDARDNTRTGKIMFAYNGRRFKPGSTVTTTVENYTINGIKLEGTRTLTNVSTSTAESPKFNVVLDNGKATFEDNTVAERESNITWQWDRNGTISWTDDRLIIDQSSTANGTTRGGRNYDLTLTEELVYKRFCGIAVSGVKRYLIDGEKEIIIDYGDGTCDKQVSVTINGVTRNLRVNN